VRRQTHRRGAQDGGAAPACRGVHDETACEQTEPTRTQSQLSRVRKTDTQIRYVLMLARENGQACR